MTLTSDPADATGTPARRPVRSRQGAPAGGAATPSGTAEAAQAGAGTTRDYHARLRYQPGFDGIRGIGLFFVLAGHSGFSWAPGGFFWVSTFFTLSAYLITSLLIVERTRTGRISLRAFWARRFRRLMPGALVTLLLIALFATFLADPTQLQRLRSDGLSALFYVANWNFVIGNHDYAEFFAGLANPSPVQHFWTLSIEEQFYIVLPLLVVALLGMFRSNWRRVAGVMVVLTVASIVWMQVLISRAPDPSAVVDRMYFGTDTRLPELAIGVLLAIVVTHWKPHTHAWARTVLAVTGPMALTIIVWNTFTVHRTDLWLYRGGFAAHAILSSLMVAAAAQPHNLVKHMLSIRPLVWLGTLSYGTYLIHWPIYVWLDERRTGLDGAALFALRCGLSVSLAWASNKYFEHPIRIGERLKGWKAYAFTPLAVAAVVVALVVVTLDPPKPAVNLEGDLAAAPIAPGEVIEDVVTVPTSDAAGSGPAGTSGTGSTTVGSRPGASDTSSTATTRARPAPRAVSGEVRILVVGDSQAFVIGNAVDRWTKKSGGKTRSWNQSVRGCGIVRGGKTDRMGVISEGVCEEWPQVWGDAVAEFKPHIVVVLTGGWDWNKRWLPEWGTWKEFGDPEFDQHITDEYGVAADILSSKGAIVAWLTAPCYALQGTFVLDGKTIVGNDPSHLNDPIISDMVETRTDRVVTLDLFQELCPGGAFTQELGGLTNVRPDGSHLSDAAADWLVSSWLGPELIKTVTGGP